MNNGKDNYDAKALYGEGLMVFTSYFRYYDGGNFAVFGSYPRVSNASTSNAGTWAGKRIYQYNFTGTWGLKSYGGKEQRLDNNPYFPLRLCFDTQFNRIPEKSLSVYKSNNKWYVNPFLGYVKGNSFVVEGETYYTWNPSKSADGVEIDNYIFSENNTESAKNYYYRPYYNNIGAIIDSFTLNRECTVVANNTNYNMLCRVQNLNEEKYRIFVTSDDGEINLFKTVNSQKVYYKELETTEVETMLKTGLVDVSIAKNFFTKLEDASDRTYNVTNITANNEKHYGSTGVILKPSAGPICVPFDSYICKNDNPNNPGTAINAPRKTDTESQTNFCYVYANLLDSSYHIKTYGFCYVGTNQTGKWGTPPGTRYWAIDGVISIPSEAELLSYRFDWNENKVGLATNVEFAGLKALSTSAFDYHLTNGEITRFREETVPVTSYNQLVGAIDNDDNTEWPILTGSPYIQDPDCGDVCITDDGKKIFCFKNMVSLATANGNPNKRFIKSADVFYYAKDNASPYSGYIPGSYSVIYGDDDNHMMMCNRNTVSGGTSLNGSMGYYSTFKNLADLTNLQIKEDATFVEGEYELGLKINATDGDKLYEIKEGSLGVTTPATTCKGIYEVNNSIYEAGGSLSPSTEGRFVVPAKCIFADAFSTASTYSEGECVKYGNNFYECIDDVTAAGSWTGNSNWKQVTIQTAPATYIGYLSDVVLTYDADPKGKKVDVDLEWETVFGDDSRVSDFFSDASPLYGSYVNIGQSLYDFIYIEEKYNTLKNFYHSTQTSQELPPYESDAENNYDNMVDVVNLEYKIEGGVDGYSNPLDIDSNPDVRLLWYLVLDKSKGDVPDSVELEVLDAKVVYQNGGHTEVSDTVLLDATERLKQAGGSYSKIPENVEQTVDTLGINDYFGNLERSSSRFRTAFRLISTSENTNYKQDGYNVMLYCRMLLANGKFKDFLVKETKVNPMCGLAFGLADNDRYQVNRSDNMVFFNNMRESEKDQLGKIYVYEGNTNSGSAKEVSVYKRRKYYDAGGSTRYNIVKVDENTGTEPPVTTIYKYTESGLEVIQDSEQLLDNNTYYVKYTWKESPDITSESIKPKMYFEAGCFVRYMPASFEFDYKGLGVFDKIKFNANEEKYENCELIGNQDSNHKAFPGNPASTEHPEDGRKYFEIYDIESQEGNGKYLVKFSGTSVADEFIAKSGSESEIEQKIYVNGEFVDIVLDGNGTKSRIVTVDDEQKEERYINLFLENVTNNTTFEYVPDKYEMFGSYSSDDITINEKYYENKGVVEAIFSEFKSFDFEAEIDTEIMKCEHDHPDNFHLADKFLYLPVKAKIKRKDATSNSSSSNSGDDRVDIKNTKLVFKGVMRRGGYDSENRLVWESDYGFVSSENGATSQIKLVVGETDVDVGKLKRSISDYYLSLTGYIVYTYEIIIGGVKRKTVTIDESLDPAHSQSVSVKYNRIRTLPPLVIMLKKTTVGYKEPITFVNCTDDKSDPVYENLKITMTDGANTSYTWNGDEDNETHMTVNQEFELGEYTFAAKADLIKSIADNNCEGISQVDSLEAPKLYILERSNYIDGVTRVLDGYNLVYPRHREDVLFSPNEWITADNINRRFEFIKENLDYLAAQTKIYLKPPSKYCGFYGDFMSVINGEYRRVFGYVPNGDVEIYKNYNEHTSIDDADTTIRKCNALCLDDEPNLYVHQNGTINIYNSSKYESYRDTIIPSLVNEYITYIDRMAYSYATNKMYLLSSVTHKLYIFNRYQERLRGTNINSTYFGEIGGYGGPWVHSKFNSPNDFFISTNTVNGEDVDEIWVCDAGNKVIKHFSIKGQWISTIDLTEVGYDLLGVCCDVNKDVHVLTDKYVLTFGYNGDIKNGFVLKGGLAKPIMIRPQYKAGFLYVLYEHWIDKYNLSGDYIGRFAEDEDFTYTTMAATENYDVYIATNKNILHYNDSLRIRTIATIENARKNEWSLSEIKINRDENIQDVVINTSFQRMYDNIVVYALCIFGKIVKIKSLDEDKRIADLDYETYQKIYDFIHKERIFVGINELVTVETINRSLNQMYDFLQLLLDTI